MAYRTKIEGGRPVVNKNTEPVRYLPGLPRLIEEAKMLTDGIDDPLVRATNIVNYAHSMRDIYFPAAFSADAPPYLSQIQSRLVIDSMILFGEDYIDDRLQEPKDPQVQEHHLRGLVQSRRAIQVHIEDYVKASNGLSNREILENIRTLMHVSQQPFYEESEHERMKGETKQHLAGMLAELKAVFFLRKNGWPQARLSSVNQDLHEEKDIIVPLDEAGESAIGIQIKSDPRRDTYKVDIPMFHKKKRVLHVVVPTGPHTDPFILSAKNGESLARHLAKREQRLRRTQPPVGRLALSS